VPLSADEISAVDRCYDALPRVAATAEQIGPFTLFLRTDPQSFPYYARPTLGVTRPVSTADLVAVRERQRQAGAPETFEWVHEVCPSLLAACREQELVVHTHPVLVLDPPVRAPMPADAEVRLLGPDDDISTADAVAHVAFGSPGTGTGTAGVAERDAAAGGAGTRAAVLARRIAAGTFGMAAAYDPADGPVSVGSYQCVPEGGEIVGVGTLPMARRRGLGAAVTAVLAADLTSRGIPLVFLGASDDDVARVYEGVGFRRIGTAYTAEPPDS